MDDDGCQSGRRDIEEDSRQRVQGQKDDDRSEDTGKRSANTCFRLYGGTGERPGSRVSAQEWPDHVREADGDKFL